MAWSECFDFVVIGAGLMGSATARYLSETGQSVAVVGTAEPTNRLDHTGPFASHYDAARITRKLATDRTWSLLSARSIERYTAMEDASGVRFFHETGAVMAAAGSHEKPDVGPNFLSVNESEQIGAAVFTSETYRTALPMLRFPDDTVIAHESKEAGYIDPRAHIQAELTLAKNNGAVFIAETVRQVIETDEDASVELSDCRRILAGTVIVATGAYAISEKLIKDPPALSTYARTIAFAELDAAEAELLSDMPSIVWYPPNSNLDIYVLPPVLYPDGKTYIKIGGDPYDVPLTSVEDLNRWCRGTGSAAVGAMLIHVLNGLLPGLRAVSTHTKSCMTTFTQSGRPLIYRHSARTIVVTGGNGAGAKNSDEIGRLAALVATGSSLHAEGYECDFSPPKA